MTPLQQALEAQGLKIVPIEPTEEMTDAQILHLWDTRVGDPNAKYPLQPADVIAFARAIHRVGFGALNALRGEPALDQDNFREAFREYDERSTHSTRHKTPWQIWRDACQYMQKATHPVPDVSAEPVTLMQALNFFSAVERTALWKQFDCSDAMIANITRAVLLKQHAESTTAMDVHVEPNNPAVHAIEYALKTHADGGMGFLRCWFHGDFDAIRKEWPDAPVEVFVGADPLQSLADEGQELEYCAHYHCAGDCGPPHNQAEYIALLNDLFM